VFHGFYVTAGMVHKYHDSRFGHDCTFIMHQDENVQRKFNKARTMLSLPLYMHRMTGAGMQPAGDDLAARAFPPPQPPCAPPAHGGNTGASSSGILGHHRPPHGVPYPLGMYCPSVIANARNRDEFGVHVPPFKERSPNTTTPMHHVDELAHMIVDGGNHEGKPFHYVAHSHACLGYRRHYYFPKVMSPTGAQHESLMRAPRTSKRALLADYMFIVHFT